MHKIISGLLSLIILCVFTATPGLAASQKTAKAPARKTAAKTAPQRKSNRTSPVARQNTAQSKNRKARIVSTKNGRNTKKLASLDKRNLRGKTG